MVDDFGQYADSVEGAVVTYLKSGRSVRPWTIGQRRLARSVLQFGMNGGAGLVHGIADPDRTILLMQSSEFDDRVWLDGVPCPSCALAVLPAGCHFSIVYTGAVEWLSWSISAGEEFSLRLSHRATMSRSLKTDKTVAMLPRASARKFRAAASEIFHEQATSSESSLERALFAELEEAWSSRLDTWELPNQQTRSAEQIVFRALEMVQSRPDARVEIADLVRSEQIGYRTFLRAFKRYLRISPKHYLKLRQINGVYHSIRKSNGTATLSDILSAHGINEFGRFAGEYNAIFGELPSNTHRRYSAVE